MSVDTVSMTPNERFSYIISTELSIPHSGGYYGCENWTDMLIYAGEEILKGADPLLKVEYLMRDVDWYGRPGSCDKDETTYMICLMKQYPKYFCGHPVFYDGKGLEEKERMDRMLLLLSYNDNFIKAFDEHFADVNLDYYQKYQCAKYLPDFMLKHLLKHINMSDFKNNGHIIDCLIKRYEENHSKDNIIEMMNKHGFDEVAYKMYQQDNR